MALSFIILFQLDVLGQETKPSKTARPAPALEDKSTMDNVTNPKIARRQHPAKGSRPSQSTAPDPNRGEVQAAEEFMQMKAEVYSDLNRLEDSKEYEPLFKSARKGKSKMPLVGGETVNRTLDGSITELPMQVNRNIQVELFKSMGSSNP
jgi:hypothetical protein